MKRLALFAFPLLCLSGPALSADLDGPVYRERETVIERPQIVEKRIIEHHYYEAAPVERRVYVEPRVYEDAYDARPYRAYAYAGWRPKYFFPRGYWHHRHHVGW